MEALPEGYETALNRGGIALSAGQRQKLALARAVLREPAILILDEATSSLDVGTEDLVYPRIRERLPTATILIVAHRPWVTAKATRLVYIEGGELRGQGCHQDLLRTCAPYRTMCQIAGLAPQMPAHRLVAASESALT